MTVNDTAPLTLAYGALFLSRYANYEQLICDKFTHLPGVTLSDGTKAQLESLFAPNYQLIFNAYQDNPTQNLPLLCEKFLDVLPSLSFDWIEIENVFKQARSADDLAPLAQLITNEQRCDWQKVSAALALTSPRCVISGGPGTGKTTTVVKLLALLLQSDPHLQIKMVAPTGKAAARLTESISNALLELPLDEELKAKIPTEASTIHRLLGVKANSTHFRHDQSKKLNLDLLLVDEASMVDLPLMAKLLTALPDKARLILLGDKDQLASVEAGAVLGDICAFIDADYSNEKATQLAELTGFRSLLHQKTTSEKSIADNLCLLRKSYRFDQYSGIGFLAKAVNDGKASSKKIADLCNQYDDLSYFANDEAGLENIEAMLLAEYRVYLENIVVISEEKRSHVKTLLKQFNQFKILCAIKEGEWGVVGLNQCAEKVLSSARLITKQANQYDNASQSWYIGRPVMITQNSYHLGLFNGDIGLCLMNEEQELRVYFQMPDGAIADFQPSRLPSHETVFAMTVHKSQGSEFSHTVLALPQNSSPITTRELIYTGITRAKNRLTLFANLALTASAIKQKTVRFSRLVERFKHLEKGA